MSKLVGPYIEFPVGHSLMFKDQCYRLWPALYLIFEKPVYTFLCWILNNGFKQRLPVPHHSDNCAIVKQIGAILETPKQSLFSVLKDKRKVKLGGVGVDVQMGQCPSTG